MAKTSKTKPKVEEEQPNEFDLLLQHSLHYEGYNDKEWGETVKLYNGGATTVNCGCLAKFLYDYGTASSLLTPDQEVQLRSLIREGYERYKSGIAGGSTISRTIVNIVNASPREVEPVVVSLQGRAKEIFNEIALMTEDDEFDDEEDNDE